MYSTLVPPAMGRPTTLKLSQHALEAGNGVLHLNKGTYRISRPVVLDLTKQGYGAVRGDGGNVADCDGRSRPRQFELSVTIKERRNRNHTNSRHGKRNDSQQLRESRLLALIRMPSALNYAGQQRPTSRMYWSGSANMEFI